jgi:hypothetical protein
MLDVIGTAELSTFSGVTSAILKPEDAFVGEDRMAHAA